MQRLMITLFVTLGLLIPASALAQGALGAITGSVVDPSGASVPAATITITATQTGVATTARTSTAGYYRVPVPVGTYHVEATKQGFQTAVVNHVVVSVAQVVTANITLQVGSTQQTVTVTGQSSLLTPNTAEVGASITPDEFQALPIEVDDGGRDIETFVFSSLPGAVGNSYQGSIN
ncbi:MAG: carboxypeptidase-like regulatory domain-containing protein, partial [Candidatus Dormibacteraceae bacterium]